MNAKEPSRKDLLSACCEVGPEDGVDPRLDHRPVRERVKNRKALQLCAQVAETLNLVLAGECGDDVLRELTVVSVVPAPDSSRMLVTLAVPADGADEQDVRAHLERAAGKMRGEVAGAIHRKRVPLLTFQVTRE
jgi:ribosome-binding factor A